MPQISQEQGVSVILRRPLLITKTLTLEPAFPPVYTHSLIHATHLPALSALPPEGALWAGPAAWAKWPAAIKFELFAWIMAVLELQGALLLLLLQLPVLAMPFGNCWDSPCRDAPLQRQMQVLWAGSDSDSDSGTGAAAGCRQSWVAWASGCCHSSWPAMSCCRCWAWGLA